MWVYGIVLLIAGVICLIIWAKRPVELPDTDPPKPLSIFWRPGVYNYDGNLYERAVLRNETTDFLLGNGVYYSSGDPREWCGEHQPYLSFPSMYEYASTRGNEKLLKRFEKDIIAILESKSLSPMHLVFVVCHIMGYYEAFKEGKVYIQWQISTDIRRAMTDKLNVYINLYGSQGGPFDCRTPRNEYYTAEAIRLIEKVKEKFSVDLLHA